MSRVPRRTSPLLVNLRRAVQHPFLSIFVGLVMVGSGLAEVARELDPSFSSILRAHHGVMLIGLLTALRGIVDAIEGLKSVGEVYGNTDTEE